MKGEAIVGNQIYIHYGSDHFDKSLMKTAKNQPWPWVKPDADTGLWGSRVDSTFGWKDWCEQEEFRNCLSENSFTFRLKDGAKVIMCHTPGDVLKIPPADTSEYFRAHAGQHFIEDYRIDFEECIRQGIDAIELGWYGEEWKDVAEGNLYMMLYGWDCDCILVLNPDAVEPIEEEK